jgi:hypothetical protein
MYRKLWRAREKEKEGEKRGGEDDLWRLSLDS